MKNGQRKHPWALWEIVQVHARAILPLGIVVLLGLGITTVFFVLYAQLIGNALYAQLAASTVTPEAATTTTISLMVPVVLFAILIGLTWAGIVVQVAGSILARRSIQLGTSAAHSIARAPRVALTALTVLLAVVGCIALAPLIVLAGILGLIFSPLGAKSRFAERWPGRPTLITMAVPFGVAAHLIVRWSLALPSIWLSGSGVRAALADSAVRSRGREFPIGVAIIGSIALTYLVTEGLVWLVGLAGFGTQLELIARLLAITVVGPLLLVALTVHYVRGGKAPRKARVVEAPSPVKVRTAIAVVLALLIPVAVTTAAAPAQAVGTGVAAFSITTVPFSPVTADAPVDVNFHVSDPHSETTFPTGTITVTIDGTPIAESTPGEFTLTGPFTPVTISQAFAEGEHTIDATYSGDANYAAGTATLTIEAVPPDLPDVFTSTAFTISPESPTPAGTPLTAHVTVSPIDSMAVPQGNAVVYLDGQGDPLGSAPLVGGVADVVFSLPPGALQVVTVRFEAADGFFDSFSDTSHTVLPWVTTVTLGADPVSSVFGQDALLSATVTGGAVPTGTVEFDVTPAADTPFTLGPVSLVNGVAQVAMTDRLPGVYTIVARYGGDGTVDAGESEPLAHTIHRAEVDIVVDPVNDAPALGDLINVTVTVTAKAPAEGTPGGSIVLKRDGDEVGTGMLDTFGVVTIPGVAVGDAGSHTFTAHYTDGAVPATFNTGVGTVDLTVGKVATTTRVFGQIFRSEIYGVDQTYTGTVFTDEDETTPSGTVTLIVDGVPIDTGTLDGDGDFSITTDEIPVNGTLNHLVWVEYAGDDNHIASSSIDDPDDVIHLEMVKASSIPVLTADTVTPVVGGPVTLTATLDDLGTGPTGKVTFYNGVTQIGRVDVVGHAATLVYTVADPVTIVTAKYEGDGNFVERTSLPLELSATRPPATVTLANPGPIVYGATRELVATVVLGSEVPTEPVEFRTSANVVLGVAVPDALGVARLLVCAGDDAVCAVGVPQLGVPPTAAAGLHARYPETENYLAGQSATVAYVMHGSPTTTTIVSSASTAKPGMGVLVTATVDADVLAATPSGKIVFSGYTPTDSGRADAFIANVDLVNGVASFVIGVGDGEFDLRWPADAITATFVSDNPRFAASLARTPFTIQRLAVTVEVDVPAQVVVGAFTPIGVELTAEAGSSADFSELITITADTGDTCTASFPPDLRVTSCSIRWMTPGPHSVTATYPDGDIVYLPGSSGVVPFSIGQSQPVLGASIPIEVMADTDVTVTWNQFDPAATGTVEVLADGDPWCTVPVQTLSCTGQFGVDSATGGFVQVRLQYSGDATWAGVEQIVNTRVLRCALIDVYSAQPSLGTVTIDTPPNCGASGWLTGTTLTVTARPTGGNEFVNWQKLGGTGLIFAASTHTTTFLATLDSTTWVRVATFRVPCYPITASSTGYGGIFVFPVSNCTMPGGGAGWLLGTNVDVYPEPALNPLYGENDQFLAFGPFRPAGGAGPDAFGRFRLAMTVTGPSVVPMIFGPVCRVVTIEFEPATEGDTSSVVAQENCQSPSLNGTLRGTAVTVSAKSGNHDLVLDRWSEDGVDLPALGADSPATYTIGASTAPVLTAHFVTCYTADIRVDGALDHLQRPAGQVNVDVPPNCPDGSKRYLAGTVLTLVPEVLLADAYFNGWDEERRGGVAGIGPVVAATKVITVDKNLVVSAGFYLESACSRLIMVGSTAELLSIENTGCGPGYYFDLQKQQAMRIDVPQSEVWQTSDRSVLHATIADVPQDVYLNVRGDTRQCFGSAGDPAGPSENTGDWKVYGPLASPGADCYVGGPITVQAQACQSIVATPAIHVVGGGSYGTETLPGVLYLIGPDSKIGAFSLDGFAWVETISVEVESDGLRFVDIQTGPCRDAGNAFPSGQDVAIWGMGPGSGFQFDGWEGIDPNGVIPSNPMLRTTTATERTMPITPSYTIECHTITIGEGISIIGDVPRCPGTGEGDNSYIAGTAIQVHAVQYIGDRIINSFNSGVVGDQITEDPDTKELTAFVYVDKDKHITADYPTSNERIERGIIQGMKIVSGIVAVAAPILLSMAFPPAGILFSVLGAAAGLAASIPGGDKVAAVFDLVNPTKITVCAAQWAFNNDGNPTGNTNVGAIVSTANTIRKVINGADVLTQPVADLRTLPGIGAKLPERLGNLPGGLSFALGGAALGYGLYSAGIGGTDLSPQTVEQLRDTSTMTSCLDEQWRAAGSDITGDG